jgi:carboxymethylenebutenolidase
LAVDLYDGEVADDSSRARELSSSIDQDWATQNLLAAEDYLRTQRWSDKVASLWWCLWGKQSLQLSLASNTLDATVIYYGRLETDPDVVEAINTPILGIFAENDQWIPPSQVEMFEEALAQVGISDQADITIYPWVDHAFANPSGNNYSAEATQQAREKTISFLQNNL